MTLKWVAARARRDILSGVRGCYNEKMMISRMKQNASISNDKPNQGCMQDFLSKKKGLVSNFVYKMRMYSFIVNLII